MSPSPAIKNEAFKISGRIRRMNIEPEINSLKYALFAFCTPARTSLSVLEIRMKTTLFCSKNRIDLSFLDLDARGKEYFGYSKKDIFGRSSYVMVHRHDYQHVRCKHTEIMTCGKTSVGTFRLMNKNNEWNWISGYGRVLYKNGKPDFLVTTNRILSEEEGMAMLKIRDQADYKALEKLGLVEPEDPSEASELGFPVRSPTKSSLLHHSSSEHAIPMPLGEFPQTEELINAHMRNGSLDKLFGNDVEVESPQPSELFKTNIYSPSNHSSSHSVISDNISHMSINSSPANNSAPPDYQKLKDDSNRMELNIPRGVEKALSLCDSSTSDTNQTYEQVINSENISQQFALDMFDDIPTEFNHLVPQPPPQPRFSFLPPVSTNTCPTTQNKTFEENFPHHQNMDDSSRMVHRPISDFSVYNHTPYNMQNNERFSNAPFIPQLLENYVQHSTQPIQPNVLPQTFQFAFNNNTTSPTSSSGDVNSLSSAHFQDSSFNFQ